MLITIQSNTPWISGFIPTALRVSFDSDAPIKNIVIVRPLRAKTEIALPTIGTPSSRYVFITIATTNQRINHGIVIFRLSFLNLREVTSANGIIHSARVNLIVVATCSACSPYAAPAPTTELVS